MFIGIDHGTTAMRFSTGEQDFKISREEARQFTIDDLSRLCPIDEIEGIAACYSMGDGIAAITDIKKVRSRGIISREGAGKHIGGGTRVYDEIERSKIPTVVIPGLHRGPRPIPGSRYTPTRRAPRRSGSSMRSCTISTRYRGL